MNSSDSDNRALVNAHRAAWPEIKRAYLAGEGSFRELSERFRVSFHTLAKRAKREGWTSQMAKLCDAVATTAMSVATERGQAMGMTAADFVERTINETDNWLTRIEVLATDGNLDPEKLQKLVAAWRTAIGVGRQTFHLDDQPMPTFSSLVNIQSEVQVYRVQPGPGDEIIDVSELLPGTTA